VVLPQSINTSWRPEIDSRGLLDLQIDQHWWFKQDGARYQVNTKDFASLEVLKSRWMVFLK